MARKTTKEQPLKFIIYARKSTESAGRQVASLDAQLEVVRDIISNSYLLSIKFKLSILMTEFTALKIVPFCLASKQV